MKLLHKGLLIVCLVLLCGLLLPWNAAAAGVTASGTCGDNLTWTLDSEGTLTISGTGAMEDYDDYDVPWREYRNSIESVMIEDGVTTIGDSAFFGYGSLTEVTVPDSVITIGHSAFSYSSLIKVTIGDSVTTIGYSAFYGCGSLTEVTIPNSVTTIGEDAFSYCYSLTEVTIPNSVITIGAGAFYGCDSLSEVTIPNSVTTIGENAFSYCDSLNGIWVSDENPGYCSDARGVLFNKDMSILLQAPGAISGSYIIPDIATTIGYSAFYNCGSLTEVTVPNSVFIIGEDAFSYSSLTKVTIGNSVATIGDNAFSWCHSLNGIWVSDENPAYCSDVRGVLFDKDMTTLIQAPSVISGSYTIPDGVTTIESGAFGGCERLIEVTIPNSVTTIGDSAFSFCYILTDVTIPNSVTTIGASAFSYCDSLTEVTIPNSVTTIGADAFYGCDNLTDVTIPNNVTTIGQNAFSYCNSLNGIWVSDENPAYCSDVRGVLFDKDMTTLIHVPDAISDSYTIPDSVTTIEDHAFDWCDCLTEVTIPNSVTTIGEWAFADCSSLTMVIFSGDAPSIGYIAFCGVTATAYYPEGNETWTEDVMQDYGGDITWVSYDKENEPGDLTGDSVVDNQDVAYLLWYTLFPEDYPITRNADFNCDGMVDNQDVAYLLWHTLFPEDYPL